MLAHFPEESGLASSPSASESFFLGVEPFSQVMRGEKMILTPMLAQETLAEGRNMKSPSEHLA